nr:ASF1-like histone chaperone [Cryptomonas curvata]
MYPIEILHIKVLNNFCRIDSLFLFEVVYEIKYCLQNDIKINAIYITSSFETHNDQELDFFTLPGKKIGKFKIVLKIRPPMYDTFKVEELAEVTVILLAFLYDNRELIRIGYYLNNEIFFKDDAKKKNSLKINYILRKILSDKPRITYFPFI